MSSYQPVHWEPGARAPDAFGLPLKAAARCATDCCLNFRQAHSD